MMFPRKKLNAICKIHFPDSWYMFHLCCFYEYSTFTAWLCGSHILNGLMKFTAWHLIFMIRLRWWVKPLFSAYRSYLKALTPRVCLVWQPPLPEINLCPNHNPIWCSESLFRIFHVILKKVLVFGARRWCFPAKVLHQFHLWTL